MFRRLKQILIGSPLETAALPEQHLSKKAALAVLASDNLSSTAYATEEILLALSAGAAMGLVVPLHYAVPIAGAIVILTAIVAISYGQTLHAYPTGGGAYTVAKENLGVTAALAGAAALLMDYILTVAVSVAAGVAAITSAVPALYSHRVSLCILAVVLILVVNLRGVRESAAVFAGPVYFFILCMFALIGGGLWRYLQGEVVPPPAQATQELMSVAYVFLLLRAFAAGCAALTGVEAVANGVRIFKPPVSRNASVTLYVMASLLATMFLGTSFLAYAYNFPHRPEETLLSQLGRAIFGVGPIYYAIQASTMAILILAANTSFADFPRLCSIVAQDRFLPRQLANLGDRLVFSNGMLFLALVAILLLVVFGGSVHALIPLYMVGVFLAFTLSQAGMVVHWRKSKEPGAGWRAAVNAVGAVATALVLLVVAVVKFKEGAWMVIVALAAIMFMFRRIRNHYFVVTRELSLMDYQKPEELRHTAVVPVAGINKMVLAAIEYARSISKDVIAVHVNRDGEHPEELQQQWHSWAPDVPLVILESPYRSIRGPLLRFIDEVRSWRDEDVVTVVIPEFVSNRWWHHFLHNQTTAFLKVALLFKPHIIVTSVPHHLRR
ncbi:MAG TPA: APC family permease [Candidatus Xenobia bacterium]|nr:APC family permease [Candidatus Xenobia bacterium]